MTTEAKSAGPIDITGFLPTQNYVLEMVSGDRKIGWSLTLCPSSHPKAKAYAEQSANRNLERSRLIEAATINGRPFIPEEKSADTARRDNVQWAVARVLEWTPISIDGKVYEFTDENATELFIRPEMSGYYAQLTTALNDETRFTQRFGKT
ncbi:MULTISPECIES: hypothetical protein [unclassified Rhizobium]|uniref:hypothetical protein n=1 Tax=unclassified Rhizobium TaxID=2613769 RepID=UPI000715B0A9|nr:MULTISPECIES: hypothetical protein [unclassified Rhizobium]KQS84123.1 hypothetical protein ASG50_29990 [Rhizobium sp. Leaf386]KQT03214.1 hypothetical protein ASG42_24715 [Rhizobium sp. Leaf391]KQU08391.1 hypothetical protein ASG68_22645 [Rhizobium sp. Leaf453]